jgi:muconate cycloisomerase
MKIAQVRTIPVWCPRRTAYGGVTRTALGPASVSDYTLVFVETDAGIVGLGEVSSVFKRRGALLRYDLEAALIPSVIGEDPFRIAHLVATMERVLDGVEEAKAGLEMAFWDIVGKALKTPLYNLLGGKVRECVPLSYSIPFGQPEQMADFAVERVKAGHRTIKVKAGSEDGARDIRAVRLIREAIGPQIRLRVDGNMGWRKRQACDPDDQGHGTQQSGAGRTAASRARSGGNGRSAQVHWRTADGRRKCARSQECHGRHPRGGR